jgi:heme-degrading monooxygenase HmoA
MPYRATLLIRTLRQTKTRPARYPDIARQTIGQEPPMSIIRLIHIRLDPSEIAKAEKVWKTECAPLMIQQQGCESEMLLRAREPGEFISYSEWEAEADIERYLKSDAHKEIVRHARGLKGAKAEVKLYDLVK